MEDILRKIQEFINENKEDFTDRKIRIWEDYVNFITTGIVSTELKNAMGEVDIMSFNRIINVLGIFECDHCGEYHFIEDKCVTADNYELCDDCYEQYTNYCPHCEQSYYDDEVNYETIDGDYCCENCKNEGNICDDCGRVILSEQGYIYAEDTGHTFCEYCADDNVYYCENCENYVEEAHYVEGRDGYLCDECYNECYTEHIHDYNYKPTPNFLKLENEKNTKEFLGVEVEVDDGDDFNVLGEVENDLGGLVYWKHDGSLSEGAEMVSQPCTIKKWLSLKDDMEQAFGKLVKAGFRSHDTSTCGYHIHISRDSLGKTRQEQDDVIDRIILITEVFKDELKKFSRRRNYHYCKFASESYSDYKEYEMDTLEKCKRFKDNCTDRYLVINNNNSNTVEFRVFRGTLNINTFIATLQFVHNVANICKKRPLKRFDGIKWADIINYTQNYKELKEYNRLRNIKSTKVIDLFKNEKRG